MSDSLARIVRTALQVIAAGGLYGVIELVAHDVQSPYILPLYAFLITVIQNAMEESGALPPLMKPAPEPQPSAPPSE